MKYQELSAEDKKLLNTDLGEFDKVAAAEMSLAQEMYATGFEKLAAETADYLDAVFAKVAEEEEKEEKKEDEDEETKKTAEELGAFIERGFFDGLRKLGAERHGDESVYLLPYLQEKVAAAGSEMALAKLAEAEGKEDTHGVRRFFLGNPVSAAIEAKKGKKLKAAGEALGHSVKETLKGGLKGGLGGAAVGALAGLASRGKFKARHGALAGGAIGGYGGMGYGGLKGHLGDKATEIHQKYSKDKKD